MALTRLQMANEVLDNLSRSGTGVTRSNTALSTRVITWLDRAQVRIARKADFLYKISTATTVADQQSYGFPSNLRTLYSLRLEDGLSSVKLSVAMPWEFDDLVPKPDEVTTGTPDWYIPYKASNTFELYRIPDGAYTMRLRHTVWPTALSSDGQNADFHTFGIDLDDVIVYYATEEGFKWLQEFVDARTWRAHGDERIEEALRVEMFWPDWQPVHRGFTTNPPSSIGEYYNDPFILGDPSTRIQ